MINKIAGWIVLIPLCLGLIVLALANRHLVALNFNPFSNPAATSAPAYGVPLFVVLYLMLLIGVLLGGIATWFAQGLHRRRERHWRREAHQLSQELETLRRKQGHVSATQIAEVDDLMELR